MRIQVPIAFLLLITAIQYAKNPALDRLFLASHGHTWPSRSELDVKIPFRMKHNGYNTCPADAYWDWWGRVGWRFKSRQSA
ncbi:MAG: hypothetical protein CM15mP68_2150 [Pseudomonadota bacterium]|nr:MAG: hypothetical protein CM15mP68_2150 [Pseudomonadota bacterium]